ncbi:MAG: OmpA family protein [Myxococcota bacterium]
MIPTDEFSASRFTPAIGPDNYFATDGTRIHGHLVGSFGVTVDYAHDPLSLYNASCDEAGNNCDIDGVDVRLVAYQMISHVHGTIRFADRIQLGLNVPLVYSSGDSFMFTSTEGSPFALQGGRTFSLGDPRLSAKIGILDPGSRGVGFAVVVFGTAPLGQIIADESFIGDSGPTAGGHFAGEFIANGIHVAGNIGGVYRSEQTLFSTRVGSAVQYRAALGWDATPLLMLIAEVEGSSAFSSEIDENPLEGRIGARLRQGDWGFALAGGGGFVSGVGIPSFRMLASVAWQPSTSDSDGDGIEDSRDGCPSVVEDIDGWMDDDGCPEADNDSDGFLDQNDPCPDAAEDEDGFEDEDGCPDLDNDNDGIRDGFDSCPMEPEDIDGDLDEDGCPDDDADGDNIPDSRDACPDRPEDTDGFGDLDGCPEEDFDLDGLPDTVDECPDAPETVNGVLDDDGCPEQDRDSDGVPDELDRCASQAETLNGREDRDGCPDGPALVELQPDRIKLMQQIGFGRNRATIQGRVSRQILDAVAYVLQLHPEYHRVRIEGHTDSRGDPAALRTLSLQRAESVAQGLAERGINPSRLRAIGLGSSQPIQDDRTSQSRAANQRIEFHIEPHIPGSE